MTIFFAVLAVILLFGMIGDKNEKNRRNFTYGFIAVVIGITILYFINYV